MTKVRSEYIKKMMNESHNLEEKLKEVAQSTISSILEEKTNQNLRQILAEDENSFSEEEVDEDVEDTNNTIEDETKEEDTVDVDNENDSVEDEEFDGLEKYKDADGEYDLRGLGSAELAEILKGMEPDDSVRICKNPDDTITVTDEGDGTEYEIELGDDDADIDELENDEDIDINPDSECEDGVCGNDDDSEVEIEMDDSEEPEDDDTEFEVELDEANLGYTDNYQNKTAMTTPDNNEPAKPNSTYSMDGGVPTGTSKPWVGAKKKSPYEDDVNEACEDEQCNEGGGEFGKVAARVSGKQHRNNSNGQGGQPYGSRHNSVAGEYKDYEPNVSESIKKKANEIFRENKQMKALIGQLQQRVNEAMVINASLGSIVKIINENSTTVEEKKDILKRFDECTTIEESKKLYNTIREELKRAGKAHSDVASTLNTQLSESRERAVETPIYQSQDLSDTLSFMNRLNKIK